MKRFADLLELLALTPSRLRKLDALRRYFSEVPDPDRGIALAVLTGELDVRNVKPKASRQDSSEVFLVATGFKGR